MELKLLALGLLQLVVANPTSPLQGLQDMQMVDDTESVGTYVRAVRATAVRISKFFYYFIKFLLLTSFYKNKEPTCRKMQGFKDVYEALFVLVYKAH